MHVLDNCTSTSSNHFYYWMFNGCTSLSSIRVAFTNWNPSGVTNPTTNWVNGVAASGTFYCPPDLGTDATITRGTSNCPTGWNVVNSYAGLRFTAQQANSTIALVATGTPTYTPTLRVSTDGETWTPYTIGSTITLANVGDKVYFSAGTEENVAINTSPTNYYSFHMTGRIAAAGNIQSMLDATLASTMTPLANCFAYLFKDCTALTSAPKLPATSLVGRCYLGMFQGCTSLTTAPELPATTLAVYCYNSMFSGCTSLTEAPTLPATTLANYCYENMFAGCTSLAMIEVKFTEWSPATATNNWVSNVAASGTFTCPTDLGTDSTITRGVSNCPTGWSVNNVIFKDYINTNVAEMNTGHIPTVNTRVTGRFRGAALGNWFVGNEGQKWRFFTAGSTNNTFYTDVNGMGNRISQSGWDTTKWYDVDAGNFYFTCTPVDGGTTLSQTSSTRSFTHTTPLKLGSATYTTGGEYERFDCAGFKIYESGVLVKDYRPAVDGNNMACFYEELSQTYCYPSSGTFLAYDAS